MYPLLGDLALNYEFDPSEHPRAPEGAPASAGGQFVDKGGSGHRGHGNVKGLGRGGSTPSDPHYRHIVEKYAEHHNVRLTKPHIVAIEEGRVSAPEGFHEIARTAPPSTAQPKYPTMRDYRPQQGQPIPQQGGYGPAPRMLGEQELQARLAVGRKHPDPSVRVRAKQAHALISSSDPELQRVGRQKASQLPGINPEQKTQLQGEATDLIADLPPHKGGWDGEQTFVDRAIKTLKYTVDSLDKPRRITAGLLGGRRREALNIIPFSDTLGITKREQSITGRDLLQKAGIVGPNLEGFDAGDVAGVMVDLVIDPLTWLSFGGSVAKSAKLGEFTAYKQLPRAAKDAVAETGKAAYKTGYRDYLKALGKPTLAATDIEAAKAAGRTLHKATTGQSIAEWLSRINSAATPVEFTATQAAKTRYAQTIGEATAAAERVFTATGGTRRNQAASLWLLFDQLKKTALGSEMLRRFGQAVKDKLGFGVKAVREAKLPTKLAARAGTATVGDLAQKIGKKTISHPKVAKLRDLTQRTARYLNTAHYAGQQALDALGVEEGTPSQLRDASGRWSGLDDLKLKPIRNSRQQVRLTANFSGGVRRETWKGVDYLVAPLSLIVEGVLNGSKGPLHYPMAEIKNKFTVWNGTPIVVYHPTDMNGSPLSAKQNPKVLEKSGIGTVRNASIRHPKLVAEGWFDIEKTKRVDPRVYNALSKGQKLELSTGLYTDNEPVTGNWNGRSYTHIARNYRPDHLAILPDQVGACAISDGCGVLVNKRQTTNGWIRRGSTGFGAAGGATLGGLAGAAIGGGVGYLSSGKEGAKLGALAGGTLGAAAGIVRGGGEGYATGTAYEAGLRINPNRRPYARIKKWLKTKKRKPKAEATP